MLSIFKIVLELSHWAIMKKLTNKEITLYIKNSQDMVFGKLCLNIWHRKSRQKLIWK